MLKRTIQKELEKLRTLKESEFIDRKEENSKLIDMYYIPNQYDFTIKKSLFKWKNIISVAASIVVVLSLVLSMPRPVENQPHVDGYQLSEVAIDNSISIEDLENATRNEIIESFNNYYLTETKLYYVIDTNEPAYYILKYTNGDIIVAVTVFEKKEYMLQIFPKEKITEPYEQNNSIKYISFGINVYASYETDDILILVKYPGTDVDKAIEFLIEVI